MSSRQRPIIGVCPGLRLRPEGLELYSPPAYADAIARAGGVPLLLPPLEDLRLVSAMLDRVQGVLLTGGADISPARYGQPAHSRTRPMPARREAFDLAVARAAARRRLPLLAICRGAQIVNVARGGTLIQDLPTEPGAARHAAEPGSPDARHTVRVEPGTLLAGIVEEGTLKVNSSHHQAIERIGRGLRRSAVAPDGVVEAVEDPRLPFFLAVQWHPERLPDEPAHAALFRALVQAARRQPEPLA